LLTLSLDLDPDTELVSDPDPHSSKRLDPDPHNECGFETLLLRPSKIRAPE
jgi:hypothetical protein